MPVLKFIGNSIVYTFAIVACIAFPPMIIIGIAIAFAWPRRA